MTTHAKTPQMAHQALVDQIHDVLDRFAGMPKIEQMAMLGQVIGQLGAELPRGSYSSAEVMQAVALNIAAGNQQASRSIAGAIQGARE